MLKKVSTLLVSALIFASTTASARRAAPVSSPALPEGRTVYLVGEVSRNGLEAGNSILKLANESKEDIFIVINSPGGSVLTGMFTLQAMKIAHQRGITIQCLVPGLAASMAFHVLSHCDKRYVFENTLLLWHPLRVFLMGTLTPAQSVALAEDLQRNEKTLVDDLYPRVGLDFDTFMHHYNAETLFVATQLKDIAPDFVTIVQDMPGVSELFYFRKGPFDDAEQSPEEKDKKPQDGSNYEIRWEMNRP
jgi:ATP-dependent protease ClpP protease subunit